MATRSVNGLLTSVDSLFTTQQERDEANLKKIYDIPISEIDDFPEHPYQVNDDEDMDRLVESIKERGIITPASIELNLSCNLRCPYCYQAGTHNGKVISDDTLDSLVSYVKRVYETNPFEDLFVKILGGEPTLVWKKFDKIYKSLLEFSKSVGIKFHLLVDTNCTLIDDLLTLEGYDSLLFTIPLSYKKCHDKVRFDAKGNGTYEKIIANINIIHQKLPDAKIVIRYNVDGNNRDFFKPFLDDIREKLIFRPLVSVNYTAELNGDPNYKNTMSYVDFVEWSSSQALDELIMAEMPVTISPIVSIEECQYRSKYSFKLFSDGTVGSCAMSFLIKTNLLFKNYYNSFQREMPFLRKKKFKPLFLIRPA